MDGRLSRVYPGSEDILMDGCDVSQPAGMDLIEVDPDSDGNVDCFYLSVASRADGRVVATDSNPLTNDWSSLVSGLPRPMSVAYGRLQCGRNVIFVGDRIGSASAPHGRIVKLRPPSLTCGTCQANSAQVEAVYPCGDDIATDCGEDTGEGVVRVMFYPCNATGCVNTGQVGAPSDGDGNPWHTPAQTSNREVELTAYLDSEQNGTCVYFKVADPDDLVPYDPAGADDNNDVFGLTHGDAALLPGEGYVRIDDGSNPRLIIVASNGSMAKAILRITDEWAGDDYLVRVKANNEPVFTVVPPPLGEFEYTRFVAWTRVYLEYDQMYDKSYDLAEDITIVPTHEIKIAAAWDDPNRLPEPGDHIRIFDAKDPYIAPGWHECSEFGEPRPVNLHPPNELVVTMRLPAGVMPDGRDIWKLTTAQDIYCTYTAGTDRSAGKLGGSVVITSTAGGMGNKRIGNPLSADVRLVDVFWDNIPPFNSERPFDDLRVEFKIGTPLSAHSFGTSPYWSNFWPTTVTIDKYVDVWFRNRNDSRHVYLVGAEQYTNGPVPCQTWCNPLPPCDPNKVQGVSSDEKDYAFVFNTYIDDQSVLSREMTAHELGHQLCAPGLVDELDPPAPVSVDHCPSPYFETDTCMMHMCMDPGDGEAELEDSHILQPSGCRRRSDRL